MAGSILTAPSTTLSTNTVWENELAYTEGARYGYDGVSLTEWASGNTTKPEIASGSTLEINGSMCEYASDTALTDISGLADGWCYIKHVVSGTVVTPTLTNTWGTWDTAKQGYYDGSGNRYSLFAMYRSGAVTKIYTFKSTITNNQNTLIQTPIQTDVNAIGHIDYDSDVDAGEKIKYQVVETIGDGTTTLTFAHSISNAGTNKRVLFVKTAHWNTTGSFVQTSDGFEEMRVEDTQVGITYDYTTNALSTYRITIAYI